MNTVRRQGAHFYLDSCWGPPKRLVPRRDNPLLTPDVLRAVVWLRRHPRYKSVTVSAFPQPRGATLGEPMVRCYNPRATGMGDLTGDLVEGLLPAYTKAIRKYEPQLYAQGKKAGSSIVGAVWGKVFQPAPAKASGPKWLPKVIDPVLKPFSAGLASEVGPKLLLPVALGLVGLFGAGYALGRRRRLTT